MQSDNDIRSYSNEQLCDLARRINSTEDPEGFARLSAELHSRGIDPAEVVTGQIPSEPTVEANTERWDPPALFRASVAYAPGQTPSTWLGPSRNSFHLVGSGSITVFPSRVVVTGRRYAAIVGLPLVRAIDLARDQICNVECKDAAVRFEVRAAGKTMRALAFWLESARDARELAALLPTDRSTDFTAKLAEHVEFERRLVAESPGLPVTRLLVAMNAIVFALTLMNGAEWLGTSGAIQVAWGSNFGPLTIDGQWWRLLTSLFLHLGIFHLALNMWALISFGAIVERLVGSAPFALIYFISGVFGGLATIAWQPGVNSVGASGAIFGVIGALLAAQFFNHTEIPRSIRRPIRDSTLVFVACAGIAGMLFSGIDNAAHLGGIITGSLMGVALWRGSSNDEEQPNARSRIALSLFAAALPLLALGYGAVRYFSDIRPGDGRYWETYKWFVDGESKAVAKWGLLKQLAKDGKLSDVDFSKRLETEVLPFWREASDRTHALQLSARSANETQLKYLRLLADSRRDAIELCNVGLKENNPQLISQCNDAQQRVDKLIKSHGSTDGAQQISP